MAKNIKQALQKLQTGSISVTHFAEESLQKIHDHRHLNAFTFVVSTDNIKQQFKTFEKEQDRKNKIDLHGIPIAVKDNFCVEGMPATCGSKMLKNFKPPYTATVIENLKKCGAVVIGKTNMDEFGMGNGTVDTIFKPTKNLWNLEKYKLGNYSFSDWHIPGGSSGGSAVAVAAGICFGAVGSDTGGSIRNPASYCGVVGLKPTYGLLSRYGLIPLVNSMDAPGILARTVDDCAILLDAMKGFDPNDSTSLNVSTSSSSCQDTPNVAKVRIGIPEEFQCPGMSEEIIECWNEVSNVLEKSGAIVSKVSLPHTKYSIACYSILNTCEVASNMARYDGLRYGHRSIRKNLNSTEALYAQTRHEGFNSVVRGRILAGNYFLLKSNYQKYFERALKVRRLIAEDFNKVWSQGFDILLTPVTLTTAPLYSEFIQWDNRKQSSVQDFCTQSANMAGIPALSLPINLSKNNLPLSLQLIGPQLSESRLFHVAKFLENVFQFPRRHM